MTEQSQYPLKKNDDDSQVFLEIEGLSDAEWDKFPGEFEKEYTRVTLERLSLVQDKLPEGMENYQKTQDEITSMMCQALGLPSRFFKPAPTVNTYPPMEGRYELKKDDTDGTIDS
jgi:hypothetical protein